MFFYLNPDKYVSVNIQNLTQVRMNIFSSNDRYYHLYIYEPFLLHHPVYRLAHAEEPAGVQSGSQRAIYTNHSSCITLYID